MESHGSRILKRLEADLFPWLGKRPLADIKAADLLDLLATLRRIESRGALETAHRAMQNAGQVFRYAVATGRAERDISGDLRGALPVPKERHQASITDPKQIGALLRAIDAYEGAFVTKCALRLAPLVFVRPGELRKAEWKEIDFEKGEWRIPAERMKMREQHSVPLSNQPLEILRELHPLTGVGIPAKPNTPKYKNLAAVPIIMSTLSRDNILGPAHRPNGWMDDMTQHYQPKRFFRQVPTRFLKRFFLERDALRG